MIELILISHENGKAKQVIVEELSTEEYATLVAAVYCYPSSTIGLLDKLKFDRELN